MMPDTRVMTWNVENLFRPNSGDDTAHAAYGAKLASLAAVINEQAPQVIALQEIGSPEALADLVTLLDGDWSSLLADPDGRGIRVGFLSRLPMTSGGQVSGFPDQVRAVQNRDPRFDDPSSGVDESRIGAMKRPALQAGVTLPDSTVVTLLTAHFKSKLITYPTHVDLRPQHFRSPVDEDERARYAGYALFQRATEAITCRARLNQLLAGLGQDRPVVFLGDLNDEPQAATTQILHGPTGSQIPVDDTGSVLNPIPATSAFAKADAGDGHRMWNLTPLIPLEQRVTRVHKGLGEVIDHILVSRALLHHANLPTVTTATAATGPPPSITDNPRDRAGEPGSDHAAVIADLTM